MTSLPRSLAPPAADRGHRGDAGCGAHALATVRPGALTALLGELARAPEATGWSVPARPGERIGRFEIVRELGRGGFGVVYEAKDTELGRSVAFKAIRTGSSDAVREQRALAEAEAAARLAHPNIVHLYDVGRSERGAFLIMELLRGESLDERLARGPLKLRDAVGVAVEISRGLAHAHEQGVVHRDLKPGNVFLCDDGQVKVLDFGLAHVFGRRGEPGGTPAYMAPEQARGEPSDERAADVYAVGVIVDELVTGRRPFDDGERGISEGGKLPEMRGAPAGLSRLVARMVARDPKARPRDGGEVHAELVAIRRAMEPRRARAAWAIASVAALAAVVLALRPHPPPLPPGRLTVAIADTVNTTGEPDLDSVAALLGKALEQSRRVAVVARSRLVKALRPTGRTAQLQGEEGSRTAARDARAHVLVLPAVRREGSAYALEVRLLDVARDEPLAVVRDTADARGSVLDALDRLSDGIRTALAEDASDVAPRRLRIAQVIPPSPEAQRFYAEAQRLESEALWEEAVAAYRRAIAVEDGFALAHLGLSFAVKQAHGDEAAADRHLDLATALIDRVPPKERLLVEALRARREGRFSHALERYDRVIAEWPQDPVAYWWAGAMLVAELSDGSAARPYLEKAIELGSFPEAQALWSLVALGRLDDALARARIRAEASATPWAFRDLAWVHRARGETAESLAAARRALALGAGIGQYVLWSLVEAEAIDELEHRPGDVMLLALEGRRRAALAALDAARPARDAPAFEHGAYHLLRLQILAGDGDGDPHLVWREVQEMFRAGARGIPMAAHVLAWLGDLERAERLAGLWPGRDPRLPSMRLYRLVRDWKRGDPEGAARGLAEAECLNNPRPTFLLGEVLADLGRHSDAVEAFRRFRRLPDEPGDPPHVLLYPRALYLEAASLERLGRRDEALHAVERLLRLWKRADPELRTLREAKALRARLLSARAP